MDETLPRLPPEIWNKILGYLPAADRFTVRTLCKYLKAQVDDESLWKDWTVVLDFRRGSYNEQFWDTLRIIKVRSAVVRSNEVQQWRQVALNLHALTTVIMERSSQQCVDSLRHFPYIKRLLLRSCFFGLLLDFSRFPVFLAEQLTYLSLCGGLYLATTGSEFILVISQFRNLESFTCHRSGIVADPLWMLELILACLPKLKHLSLSGVQMLSTHGNTRPRRNPPLEPYSRILSSLEVVECVDISLSADVMRFLPGLKNLSIFYKYSHLDVPAMWPWLSCRTKLWLDDLPQLSTLVIVQGPPIKKYVSAIPATLTSLTLCVPGLTSEDMATIAVQASNLFHLYIDPSPTCLKAIIGEIPRLFPKLKSLKISYKHVSQEDFLGLHHLQDLEYLEIVDNAPDLDALAEQLRALTDYRLQIKILSCERNVLSCFCVSRIY